MDGNALIIGAGEANILGAKSGAAVVFRNDGGQWVEDSVLLPSDGGEGYRFGWSVDIQDDYIFIGAYHDGGNGLWAGAVYVYKHDPLNSVWVQHQKLVSSDIELGDEFGVSVSVSEDRLLIGAMGDGSHIGAAYVFKKNGSDWIEEAKLIPLNYSGDEPYFGASVCLDGNFAVIGAPMDDEYVHKGGSAFVFHFDGDNWMQQQKLISGDVNPADQFGNSVSVDGECAMVGSINAINQTIRSGAVYVFNREGAQWSEQQKLSDNNAAYDIAFGACVSMQGDYAIFGAPDDGEIGGHSGSAYVYEYDGDNWVQVVKLLASDGQESDRMGWSVDFDGGRAISGAVLQDAGGYHCGAVYIYQEFVSAIEENGLPLDFVITPVPATNTIRCKMQDARGKTQELKIYNVSGKEVNSMQLFDEEVDVSRLAPGLYFIRLQVDDRFGIQKIIIQ